MRKNLFTFIALSACAIVACNKQEKEITCESAETVEMTVIAGESVSKTALSGSSIIWSGSEKITVIEKVAGGTDNGKFFFKTSSEGTTSNGGATMNFNVSLNSHSEATGFQYVALYPSSSFQAVTNFSNITVNTLDTQNPTATSYDPVADMLISQISTESATQPTSINMSFARKTAIGQMIIKNLGSSEDITSVTFSAQKKNGENYEDVLVAGRSKIDFTNSSVNYGSNIKKYALTLDYQGDGIKLNNSEGAPVFFVSYLDSQSLLKLRQCVLPGQ